MWEERGDCIWMWISLLYERDEASLPTYPTNAADNAVVAAAAPTVLLSPRSISFSRMTKPRESWPAAAAPKPSAAARTVFAILSILPLSSFVLLFRLRLHPPYMYSDTLCNMKG